jgi:hypothetical protein
MNILYMYYNDGSLNYVELRDSEIGCPDAQDGLRNVLGNLIATIVLSVVKCFCTRKDHIIKT